MSNTGCWGCHRFAPGSVCLGPHPDYDHSLAVSRGHVRDPFKGIGQRIHPAEARPVRVRGSIEEARERVRTRGTGGPTRPDPTFRPEPANARLRELWLKRRCPHCGRAALKDKFGAWCEYCAAPVVEEERENDDHKGGIAGPERELAR